MDLIYNDVGGSSCSVGSSREERKNKCVLVVVIGRSCCLNQCLKSETFDGDTDGA